MIADLEMQKPDPKAKEKRKKQDSDWITENLEAVVVAIVMALVIRQFCIEAFRIPTSSMEPTLIGRETGGDRILVNKFAYQIREPERWEVIVFKYPLNMKKNFIKRLVGMPGEELMLRGGDVYVKDSSGRFLIQRKPPDVQDILWQEVYPVEDAEWSNGIGTPARGEWRAVDGTRLASEDLGGGGTGLSISTEAGGTAWMYYNGFVYAHGERVEMGDVRISLKARPEPGFAAVRAVVAFGPDSFEFRLPAPGCGETEILRNRARVASSAATLPEAECWDLAFAHVDARVYVSVGGKELLSFEYDSKAGESGDYLSPVLKIGSEGSGMRMEDLRIHRDLYYFTEIGGSFNDRGYISIDPDHYLVLGDNSSSSKDSRLWTKVTFETLDGGTVEGDADPALSPNDPDKYFRDEVRGEVFMTDVNGRRLRLKKNEVKDFYPRREFAPFVPRENLIGKAFMVFYPVKRLKLIQ